MSEWVCCVCCEEIDLTAAATVAGGGKVAHTGCYQASAEITKKVAEIATLKQEHASLSESHAELSDRVVTLTAKIERPCLCCHDGCVETGCKCRKESAS